MFLLLLNYFSEGPVGFPANSGAGLASIKLQSCPAYQVVDHSPVSGYHTITSQLTPDTLHLTLAPLRK